MADLQKSDAANRNWTGICVGWGRLSNILLHKNWNYVVFSCKAQGSVVTEPVFYEVWQHNLAFVLQSELTAFYMRSALVHISQMQRLAKGPQAMR